MVDHYLVAKIEYIPSFEEKIESSDEDFSLFDKETYVIAIDLSGLEKIHIWPPSPIIEESAIKKFDQNNTIETYSWSSQTTQSSSKSFIRDVDITMPGIFWNKFWSHGRQLRLGWADDL